MTGYTGQQNPRMIGLEFSNPNNDRSFYVQNYNQFASPVPLNEAHTMAPCTDLGSFNFGTLRPTTSLVQFPFDRNPESGCKSYSVMRCKRKTNSPPLQSSKQHITEEKMAEHMAKLHISSETAPLKEAACGRTKRLYMCEEMRKLQSETILPQCLLSRYQKPCTALVLWTPPQKHNFIPAKSVGPLDKEQEEDNKSKDFLDSSCMENDLTDMENIVIMANDISSMEMEK